MKQFPLYENVDGHVIIDGASDSNYSKMVVVCLLLFVVAILSGCSQPVPVVGQKGVNPIIYAYMQPSCFIFCTTHLSTIRDEALATGTGSITGGSNSSSSSSASTVQGNK